MLIDRTIMLLQARDWGMMEVDTYITVGRNRVPINLTLDYLFEELEDGKRKFGIRIKEIVIKADDDGILSEALAAFRLMGREYMNIIYRKAVDRYCSEINRSAQLR